jgi:hypothetical protein
MVGSRSSGRDQHQHQERIEDQGIRTRVGSRSSDRDQHQERIEDQGIRTRTRIEDEDWSGAEALAGDDIRIGTRDEERGKARKQGATEKDRGTRRVGSRSSDRDQHQERIEDEEGREQKL